MQRGVAVAAAVVGDVVAGESTVQHALTANLLSQSPYSRQIVGVPAVVGDSENGCCAAPERPDAAGVVVAAVDAAADVEVAAVIGTATVSDAPAELASDAVELDGAGAEVALKTRSTAARAAEPVVLGAQPPGWPYRSTTAAAAAAAELAIAIVATWSAVAVLGPVVVVRVQAPVVAVAGGAPAAERSLLAMSAGAVPVVAVAAAVAAADWPVGSVLETPEAPGNSSQA